MKLIKRKASSVEELKNKLSTELEIFGNKNCLSSFDENTEIVIIGTYIPHNLDYFYFGKWNHRIYGSIIDVARNTDFENMRKLIINSKDKDNLLNIFIQKLKDQKIAFLDLFEHTLINPKSTRDNSIVGFTIDSKSLEKIKNSKTLKLIVPISKAAEEILRSEIGDNPKIEYHQLINGGTNKEWIDLFKNISKR